MTKIEIKLFETCIFILRNGYQCYGFQVLELLLAKIFMNYM